MSHSFIVYIDESGDEGFTFRPYPNKGSSDWFVLSAVILRVQNDKVILSRGDAIREAVGLAPKSTLHFAELAHDKRVRVIEEIAKSPVRVISVIINKHKIARKSIFTAEPFRLYRYTTRLLLERVSWFCRDFARDNMILSPEAKIIFEHRKRMSYDTLRGYIRALNHRYVADEFLQILMHDVRIHWPVINISKISAAQKHDYTGLQFADFVASGIRWALEESRYGNTEHRYAKLLSDITYSNRGNFTSYGLKFFPVEPDESAPNAHWINKHYK